MSTPEFPFVPKSSQRLVRGQFWSIPLADGRFGAGCVVGQRIADGIPSTRLFLAGVVRWIGASAPKASDLNDCDLLDVGFAHIKTIINSGGCILGAANLRLDDYVPRVDASAIKTYGYGVPKLVIERHFGADSNGE